MAVIGRKSRLLTGLFWSVLILVLPLLGADDKEDAREAISYVAAALTTGNTADAMTPFDKSCPNYDKLRSYFAGLTSAFQVVSEIEITGEQGDKQQMELSVHWALTLSDRQANYTQNRAADIDVKLNRLKGKWKIVSLEPIEFFNPAANHAK